jgi:leader peptidase (prepilin peptidase)/N-methyltransferase
MIEVGRKGPGFSVEAFFAFLFGLLIGSFLNVCIYRMPRDISVFNPPRSHCPNCDHQIRWYDNIPVMSFMLLRGKCRDCKAPISLRYPLVEILTGAVFCGCVLAFGVTAPALKYILFGSSMIALIFADFEERILPDEFTIGGTVVGLILSWFVPLQPGLSFLIVHDPQKKQLMSLTESALGAVACAGVLWIVGKLYQKVRQTEGLGFGDVKMVMMIGAFLGLQSTLLTVILGSVIGSVVGLLYIYLTGKNASTYELPFGSFLGLAATGVAVFGDAVLRMYLRLGN